MPLAITMMSGCTPDGSIANIVPERQKPDWTSSAMKRMPCSSQISRRPRRNDAGAA